MKQRIVCVAVIIALMFLAEVTFSFEVSLEYSQNMIGVLSNTFKVKLEHRSETFFFLGELLASNDGKYKSPFSPSYYGGYYFLMKNGGVGFNLGGLKARFGRFEHRDIVDTPYSLFISSSGLPTLISDICYEDDRFIYETRWIKLNEAFGDIPDRGANYKVYALKLDNFRFGYQEAVVYTGRFFDAEYFFNPIPNFFVQYTLLAGRPIPQGSNANSLMGFFADYENDELYLYGQILVDDFNMNRFMHPDWFQNPDKVAWSLGGHYKTDFGTFGFYHAGATKYTFESFGNMDLDTKYSYVYFPVIYYESGDGNAVIPLVDNYVGYKYGENNLAFMLSYAKTFGGTDFNAFLEFVISGSKSPANPWHEDVKAPEGTHLLDEFPLEKMLIFEMRLGNKHMEAFIKFGKVWNELVPVDVGDAPDSDDPVLKPGKEHRDIFELGFSLRFSFGV